MSHKHIRQRSCFGLEHSFTNTEEQIKLNNHISLYFANYIKIKSNSSYQRFIFLYEYRHSKSWFGFLWWNMLSFWIHWKMKKNYCIPEKKDFVKT